MIETDVIQIQQNVPYEADIVIYDDTVDPEVPLDITGLTVIIAIKELNDFRNDDNEALVVSTIVAHIDPTNGHTVWALTKTETYQATKRYKADLRLYTSALVFINSATFYVDIVPVVTRTLP